MLNRLKNRTKRKTKKSSPQGVRKHISLPLIDTATQVDYSPKILNPRDSLLSYSVASAPPQSDGEEGYSTVREGPIIVVTEGRNTQKQDVHFRSLPPIPSREQDDSTQRKSSGDRSGSSLASVTPNEEHEEKLPIENSNNNQLLNEDSNAAGLRSVYAKVNKSGKRRNTNSQQSPKDRNTVRAVKGGAMATEGELQNGKDRGVAVVRISSEIFELSDSNDSYDDSLVFEGSFLEDESEQQHHHVPPPQSSPVILHRPPPSPSPNSGGRNKGTKETTVPKSNSNKSQKTEAKKNSDSKQQKKRKPLSPDAQQLPRDALNMSDMANLPVYNLNQSSLNGGYVLSRTDPEGRVEYFRAMPVYSPTTVSPLPPQESPTIIHQGGYGLPVGSSTPLKHLPSDAPTSQPHLIPILQPDVQFSVPSGLPHDSLPHTSYSSEQQSIHLLPQLSIHSSTNPQNLSTFQQPRTTDHSLSLQQQTNAHRLSASHPQLNASSIYVAGLTEIDQLLTEHQTKTTSKDSSIGASIATNEGVMTNRPKPKVAFQRVGTGEVDGGKSLSHSDKSSDDILKDEELLKTLTDENSSLKQTISHLSQQLSKYVPQEKPESTDNNRLSPQKLITETPMKLKRILDKLLSDNMEKNRQIELLKCELSDLSIKNAELNESYKEQLCTNDADRQTLRDSLIQVREDNKQLKKKLSATSKSLNSANKEHEERVYKLKREVEELKNEVSRFQSNIHTTGHQYADLQGMVEACSDHTHLSLEGHKRTLAGLEKLLHQVMHKSNALSNQQMVETARVKQLNDVLSADLAEVKGRLSVLNEECEKLRKQKIEYEGIVTSLTRDLKFSQAREMQAVKCLNDSLRESEMSNIQKLKSEHSMKAEPLLSHRELQLEEMMKKMDEHKITMKLERQKKLDKLQHHRCGHQKKSKESKTVSELKSELAKKEQLLDEVYRGKRIAEKQRDILWESKLKNTH